MRRMMWLWVVVFALSALPAFADKLDPSGAAADPPSICDGVGSLVANCGFETGDFTGWTLSGNLGFTGVSSSIPNSGAYGGFFGAIGSDTVISQVLPTTPGLYDISFYLLSDGGTPNDFAMSWNGVPQIFGTNIPAFPYTQFSLSAIAGLGGDQISFAIRDDPGFMFLDDVIVTAVPEPGSMLLVGSGLLALARFRRVRK